MTLSFYSNYFPWYSNDSKHNYQKRMNIKLIKKPLAWIVDSTVYLSEKLKNHPDCFSIPLNIFFGDKQYTDGVDLTTLELYEKIKNAKEFPKSSQPSAGAFAEKYKVLAEEYDEAIAIHLSDKLSGTLTSSKSGAEMTGFPVTFIDSLSLSYGTTALVERGMEMHENGASVSEIEAALTAMAGSVNNYISFGNLEQLYKGGRVGGMQFFLGSLLKVKPIVQMSKIGELDPIDKVRSEKRALKYLIDKSVDAYSRGIQKIYLMHGNALAQAENLKNLIIEQAPNVEVEIGELSSVLAVHAGEGTLGILWVEDE